MRLQRNNRSNHLPFFIAALLISLQPGCTNRQVLMETVRNDTREIDRISMRVDSPTPELHNVSNHSTRFTPRQMDEIGSINYLDISLH